MSLHAQTVLGYAEARHAFVLETKAAALRVATTYLAWAAAHFVSQSHNVDRFMHGTILDARLNTCGNLLRAAAMRCDDAQIQLSNAFIKRVRADACPDDIADEVGNGIFDA